jgi:hypothetical protein
VLIAKRANDLAVVEGLARKFTNSPGAKLVVLYTTRFLLALAAWVIAGIDSAKVKNDTRKSLPIKSLRLMLRQGLNP